MKKLVGLIPIVLFCTVSFGQNQDTLTALGNRIQGAYLNNPDSVKAISDRADQSFKWDIQNMEKGTMMFLDVPYKREGQDSADYLTLAVAKDKVNKRPVFISIIVPNNVTQAIGVSIKFSYTRRDGSGNWQIDMDKSEPVKIPFAACSDEKHTCTARIIGGFAVDERTEEKIDIFQKFMEFDHVYFNFVYPDGTKKSVGVPLYNFKQQYQSLQ